MKTCSLCKKEFPATLKYFHARKRAKDGLASCCRKCGRLRVKKYDESHKAEKKRRWKIYYESHKMELKRYRKVYLKIHQKTLSYYISHLMNSIKTRCYNTKCNKYKYWGGRGIELEFTRQELENWLSKNNIDPRGLQIHRIDNDGNYALDNIEFLTRSEHITLHWRNCE